MNSRARLNLALLGIAGALGFGVFFATKEKPKGPPLLPIAPSAVTHVVIAHPDAPAIDLVKSGEAWRMTAPVATDVDPFEMNALTDLAARETADPISSPDLKQLGLDPPAYTITLNDTKVAFGGQEPLQYRRYVKVGELVALIEDPASAALDKDYSDLVAKDLFPAGSEIEKIELPKLTLAKDGDGKWSLTPADPAASADQMQKLADGWRAARSMWNEAATPVDTKMPRVKVTLKGGAVHEFVVAGTEPQLKIQPVGLGINYVMSKALEAELLELPKPQAEPKAEEKPDAPK